VKSIEEEIERLKERVEGLEREMSTLRAIKQREPMDLTIRPPFKQDRALREYYSKICTVLAQIAIGTAVVTFITSLATGGIKTATGVAVLILMSVGTFLIYTGGKLQPPHKE
jgi:di/tricarboxylate transporter